MLFPKGAFFVKPILLIFFVTLPTVCLAAQNYELFFSKGMLSFNQGNYEEALPAFTSAAQRKPDLPTLQYYLGLTHLQLGNNRDALTAFEKVVSLDPTFPRIHYDRGVVH